VSVQADPDMQRGQASSTARPALMSAASCASTHGANRTPSGVNDSRNTRCT